MNAQIVSFHCVLKNIVGQVISTTFNHDVITSVETPQGEELPALARAMKNLRKGEMRRITLSAEEAYGMYDPTLVEEHPRESLSEELRLGDRVHMAGPAGKMLLYRVTQIGSEFVVLDANHPLAGQDLIFDIDVVDAREATRAEIFESSYGESQSYIH